MPRYSDEKKNFLSFLPGSVYRYIDGATGARPPISSATRREDLNIQGYDEYITVNGFENTPNAQKDNCTSINAFFIDIDGRKDLQELEDIKKKLDPTYIIETKNGYHIYWMLKNPIFKNKVQDWEYQVKRWEDIEQAIVIDLKSDPKVKDLTRILRLPGSFYWKKTGEAYKQGTANALKVKGIYKNTEALYTMDEMANVFPVKEQDYSLDYPTDMTAEKMKQYADNGRKNFFKSVNEKFPVEERESFHKLISGEPGTLPDDCASRNVALLITATLMRQAGWSIQKALEHFKKIGWHGIEKEQGGWREIQNAVSHGFNGEYTYSYKNEIIAHNMSEEESLKMDQIFAEIFKLRKEHDKIRFTNYERELYTRYPHLRKNEAGIIFQYEGGVYKMLSDQDFSSMILNGLYEDMLWNYRTNKNVADKKTCLISIIKDFKISEDLGNFINVKNGLLDIRTRELHPHNPTFVSLIQYPVVYDPTAKCPTWDQCIIDWTFGEEQEKKALLLQQFAGYCLTSSTAQHKAMFLIGEGGHGKSTFEDTIGMMIGPEATSNISLEDLYSQFGLQGLIGKRLNIVEEVSENYYQSNILKKLISGEEVTINMKYKNQFKFRPQVKFMFACNVMPRVDDASTATERRICAVRFNSDFKQNPNTRLRGSRGLLFSEASGILNWMLDGLDSLATDGKFIVTNEQLKLLKEYRQENSSVEGFIEECLSFGEGFESTTRELYEEYKYYCQKDGRKFKGNVAFTKELIAYGDRNGKLKFFPRGDGHEASGFDGVTIDKVWAQSKSPLSNYNKQYDKNQIYR